MCVGLQPSHLAEKILVSGEDAVYGILYEMDPINERILDLYEGGCRGGF